ncbi:DsbA family protein [Roseomonas sp. SSH11]|uniref:DsbA family protein n=1 Tax=Pararoseomonas baculiformis TaxID=2820812 RepID=A0ABS4AD40_9PROT|nr:DsbA family protein [Pararoseomonas baculiformis]MBP0444159.1 DsbA family protein [Pararoseomonas baculiformis]
MKKILMAGAALLMAGGVALAQVSATPGEARAGFSPQQREEIVSILREALRTDPSILRDAIGAMQEAQRNAQETARREALAASRDALFNDARDPIKGNPRGDVTIVEFFDARCGYCKALHPSMQALLQRDRNIRVVMKDLPILGPNSVLASRALLAAQKQGKYEPLYDALLRLRTDPTEQVIQAEAQRAGIDWARLRRDMDDPAIQARLQANIALAERLQIEGTPALVIGDTLVPGAVELPELERLVAQARRRG